MVSHVKKHKKVKEENLKIKEKIVKRQCGQESVRGERKCEVVCLGV